MSTANNQLPLHHRVIITYLCIILGFVVLALAVWVYFDAEGRRIQNETPPKHLSQAAAQTLIDP